MCLLFKQVSIAWTDVHFRNILTTAGQLCLLIWLVLNCTSFFVFCTTGIAVDMIDSWMATHVCLSLFPHHLFFSVCFLFVSVLFFNVNVVIIDTHLLRGQGIQIVVSYARVQTLADALRHDRSLTLFIRVLDPPQHSPNRYTFEVDCTLFINFWFVHTLFGALYLLSIIGVLCL